jgi:anti-anti-sigma regulatory factor
LVSLATVGRICVLSVVGQADRSAVKCMRSALTAAERSLEREVWVDLTHLRCLDVRIANQLGELQATLHRHQRELVVICPPGAVRRTLGDAVPAFVDFASAHAAKAREVEAARRAVLQAASESVDRQTELVAG